MVIYGAAVNILHSFKSFQDKGKNSSRVQQPKHERWETDESPLSHKKFDHYIKTMEQIKINETDQLVFFLVF